MSEVLLEAINVSKRFGATRALSKVSFDVRAGEIHALTGENGAGKSTLMKIISGNYSPDKGEIRVRGQEVSFSNPSQASAAGIAIIHQELNTIPEMTVAENLALGAEPTKGIVLDRKSMIRSAKEKLALVGADIDPTKPIGRLSVGMQQMIEIARAISEQASVLVLDEPTAALSQSESRTLFELLYKMRDSGMGLIYISHRMEEIWELADRVTVFRDGQLVGTREKSEADPADIVHMMVGREVHDLYARSERRAGEVRLSVDGLAGEPGVGPVSFDVKAGEVVTLVGLVGAGRTEIVRLLYGADKPSAGSASLDGEPLKAIRPKQAIDSGVGLLPESRKDQALFLLMSVTDNVSISTLSRWSKLGVIALRAVRKAMSGITKSLSLRAASDDIEVRSLSGGNQQKVVLARLLAQNPRLLLLDEPTRGVDIGAKSEIYKIINDIAKTGAAILIVSSDLPEALGISDRLLVMRGGRIAAELDATNTTEEEVMEYATGVKADA
ncbi:MAG: sugar ABC transporter ATP-binding protein [Propionibacteriaceae bacterium]|jgi:ribose transport system ATP-binding protein|nr:sugar ABC transporter ATP-binding protein [Propionibacteriaceae bacterium]